jgi:hypothetical protein
LTLAGLVMGGPRFQRRACHLGLQLQPFATLASRAIVAVGALNPRLTITWNRCRHDRTPLVIALLSSHAAEYHHERLVPLDAEVRPGLRH